MLTDVLRGERGESMSAKYSKLKRREIKELIQKEYDLKAYNMHEWDKNILFYTNKGDKIFKKVKKDESQILFVASAYKHIKDRGFDNTSMICKTVNGKYYVKYDKNLFILQNSVRGKYFTIESEKDGEKAGRTLANFHKAADCFIPVPGSRAKVDWGKWQDKAKIQSMRLRKFKTIAQEKPYKSKFDKLFLNNADELCSKIETAYMLLQDSCYLEKVYQSMQTNQLCHKNFKKHSLMVMDDGEIFTLGMENCGYDIRETDIISLLESCLSKKNKKYAPSVIKGYREVLPLDKNSINIIKALLLQPSKYYKVANRYYGEKKGYNEFELMKSLERSIRKEGRKEEILKKLEEVME